MSVRTEVIAILHKYGRPILAEEIADEIQGDEGSGINVSALRTFLRDMVARKEVKIIERAGMKAMYAMPGYVPVSELAGQAVAPAAALKRPIAADLLAAALAEPERRIYGEGSEYMDAVHVLRSAKRLTWKEVVQWLASQGVTISQAAIAATYKRWVKERPTPAAKKRVGAEG